ncbi:hypothetical protein [Streptomyces sp. NPDC002467]|uniref:hypothetical protein n=1 Tax=Streptomyces sp. NPDC002467 TaxID=3364647 RepID=UPI00368AFEB3
MDTLIDLAIVAVSLTGAWVLHRFALDDDTAPPATNRRAQLLADLAAQRALRNTGVEQAPGDPYSDDRITAELCFIPHQTRRTEEDQ